MGDNIRSNGSRARYGLINSGTNNSDSRAAGWRQRLGQSFTGRASSNDRDIAGPSSAGSPVPGNHSVRQTQPQQRPTGGHERGPGSGVGGASLKPLMQDFQKKSPGRTYGTFTGTADAKRLDTYGVERCCRSIQNKVARLKKECPELWASMAAGMTTIEVQFSEYYRISTLGNNELHAKVMVPIGADLEASNIYLACGTFKLLDSENEDDRFARLAVLRSADRFLDEVLSRKDSGISQEELAHLSRSARGDAVRETLLEVLEEARHCGTEKLSNDEKWFRRIMIETCIVLLKTGDFGHANKTLQSGVNHFWPQASQRRDAQVLGAKVKQAQDKEKYMSGRPFESCRKDLIELKDAIYHCYFLAGGSNIHNEIVMTTEALLLSTGLQTN